MNGSRTKQHKDKQAEQTRHTAEPPFSAAISGSQASLLALQRAAGNHAVSELLHQNQEPAPISSSLTQQLPDQVSNGGGQVLEPQTREHMERRFGKDFSAVRVHTNPQAEESASQVNAKAYTVGNSIIFGRGRYAPKTRDGEHLIAHELAHVVQQSRGGSMPNLAESSQLETAAKLAAMEATGGSSGAVNVMGAAAPSIMRQPDEEEEKVSPRAQEKLETQKREQERAAAGKEPQQLSQKQAELQLRKLEEDYKQPGAQQRSLQRKAEDLKRFQKLLKLAGGTQLEKNQRQGTFDELQRTPTRTSGVPQTKHVAGIPQQPGMELRPGKDRYAQPDYSVFRQRKDGTFERVHVNLKSDQIDLRTPAKARATARAYVEQAIRNSRHLAQGESIVISFARTPSKEIQVEMNHEFFKKNSPVSEVRFGSTTHNRANYKPPAAPATPPKAKAQQKPAPAAKPAPTPQAAKPTQTPPAAKPAPTPQAAPTPPVKTSPATAPKVKVPTNVTGRTAKIRLPSGGAWKNMGRGVAAGIAGLVVQYLMGKWMAKIEQDIVSDQIKKKQPEMEAKLKEALIAQSEELVRLMESNPNAEIYINIRLKLISMFSSTGIQSVPVVEIDRVGYSLQPWNPIQRHIETVACIQSFEVEGPVISEKVPIKELFEE